MPASLPAGRPGQALAAAIALLALLAAWLGLMSPMLDFYGERQDRLAALMFRADREAALVADLPALRAQAEAASRAPARAVLAGDTDAIAGATLQEQVQTMASGASVQLTSIETLPGEQVGNYRRIGVRVELNAPLGVLTALLRAIEDAQPSMRIDDIRLTATPVAPQSPQLPLDGAFTVYSFRIGTARDDAPAKDDAP